jgi:hypothetical protein
MGKILKSVFYPIQIQLYNIYSFIHNNHSAEVHAGGMTVAHYPFSCCVFVQMHIKQKYDQSDSWHETNIRVGPHVFTM